MGCVPVRLDLHMISSEYETSWESITVDKVTQKWSWKEFRRKISAKPECNGATNFSAKVHCATCNKDFDINISQARVLKITPQELQDSQLLKTVTDLSKSGTGSH